jgi:general secretion pathway protein G
VDNQQRDENKMRAKRINGQHGFTLIEIMVVVVILAVLGGIVTPMVLDYVVDARITAAKQDINNIETALDLYKLDNYGYPTTEQGLEALVSKPSGSPEPRNWRQYMQRLPKDPWGEPYIYISPGDNGAFDLYTLGADRMDGGEGEAADIGNWMTEE